jgi:prevent-host-death family protein
MAGVWPLQEAKNRFSELVDRVLKEGAQVVTRHGRKVVVVLPYEDYERLARPQGSLAEYLLHSPLAGSELVIERERSLPRDIEIES